MVIILLATPSWLASVTPDGAFSAPVACEDAHDELTYRFAGAVYAEARGESLDGKLALISALRNGARGYKVGKLDNSLVELVSEEMKKPVRHPYKFWINFEGATDRRQIRIAKKAKKLGLGKQIGSHWFY